LYVPPGGIPVDPEVREYDPAPALYGGGADGLEVPRAVVAGAARTLRPGGTFVMEHGADQGEQVREVVRACGAFTDIETRQDLTGRDRMAVACRIGPTPSCRTWCVADLELRDCTDAGVAGEHLTEAVRQLADGPVFVLPTDTVYGIGQDA